MNEDVAKAVRGRQADGASNAITLGGYWEREALTRRGLGRHL